MKENISLSQIKKTNNIIKLDFKREKKCTMAKFELVETKQSLLIILIIFDDYDEYAFSV